MKGGWKGRNHRLLEGSYTVEAAVLLPVLLAVVIALMQICFILHDKMAVRGILELVALQITEEGAEKGFEMEKFVSEEINQQLLISTVTDVGICKTRTGVEVFVRMEFGRMVPLYFGSGDSFEKEYSATRKIPYAKEKTMVSEILLGTLHLLE